MPMAVAFSHAGFGLKVEDEVKFKIKSKNIRRNNMTRGKHSNDNRVLT